MPNLHNLPFLMRADKGAKRSVSPPHFLDFAFACFPAMALIYDVL